MRRPEIVHLPILKAWFLTGARRRTLIEAYQSGFSGEIPDYSRIRTVTRQNFRHAYLQGVAANGHEDGTKSAVRVTNKEYWQSRDKEAVDTYLNANIKAAKNIHA